MYILKHFYIRELSKWVYGLWKIVKVVFSEIAGPSTLVVDEPELKCS